jgi:hypothetical protein
MTQQNEDKGKATGTTQSTPVQDEQAKTKPATELRDEELEKATGGSVRPAPPDPC